MVKFAGLPVPGATITATQGDKKLVAVTDPQGQYSFADLADGVWNLQVEMLCFSTLKMEVAVAPNSPSPEWELKILPFDEIKASAPAPAPAPAVQTPATPAATPQSETAQVANPSLLKPSTAADAAEERRQGQGRGHDGGSQTTGGISAGRGECFSGGPPAGGGAEPAAGGVDEAAPGANDALLVNGSVSNGVERRAIGNFRKGPGSGYRGDVSSILDNSALNARNFSLTGQDTPRSPYNHVRFGVSFGGPLAIPHLFRTNNGNFFIGYQGMRNRNASTQTALVPTAAERSGDLSQTLNQLGQPVVAIDPSTGAPFPGNIIPVNLISPQAKVLFSFYPLPNFSSIALQLPDSADRHQRLRRAYRRASTR